MMSLVLPFTTKYWGDAIIMPNTKPPITSIAQAQAYADRINRAIPESDRGHFNSHMTCYLTDNTNPKEIQEGFERGIWAAAKFYPAGATTNSAEGVTSIEHIYPVLAVMQTINMPLLMHGEQLVHHDEEVDIFDREKVFLEQTFACLVEKEFPGLKVVLEHVTTGFGTEVVCDLHSRGHEVYATITPHHLVMDRNDIFRGGICPDKYCLPIAKRAKDMKALRLAATSESSFFFAGTDSAPHERRNKYNACGCAGIFNAPTALAVYTQIFEEEGALDQLSDFLSGHGRALYGLSANKETIVLKKQPWKVIEQHSTVVPFMAGEILQWQVTEST